MNHDDLHQMILKTLREFKGCSVSSMVKALNTVVMELERLDGDGVHSMSQVLIGSPRMEKVVPIGQEADFSRQLLDVGAFEIENAVGAKLNDLVLVGIRFESGEYETLSSARVVGILSPKIAAIQLRSLYKFEIQALQRFLSAGSTFPLGSLGSLGAADSSN